LSKPTPLSGYPEFLPAERAVEREGVARISRTFELHGFSELKFFRRGDGQVRYPRDGVAGARGVLLRGNGSRNQGCHQQRPETGTHYRSM